MILIEFKYHANNRCEIPPNPCNSQPCQNGGLCSKVTDTTFACSCLNGYTGIYLILIFLIEKQEKVLLFSIR